MKCEIVKRTNHKRPVNEEKIDNLYLYMVDAQCSTVVGENCLPLFHEEKWQTVLLPTEGKARVGNINERLPHFRVGKPLILQRPSV